MQDPTLHGTWSGTPYHMIQGFEAGGHEVVPIGPMRRPADQLLKLATRARNKLAGPLGTYSSERERFALTAYARQIAAAVGRASPEVLIAPGSVPVSLLDVDIPVVIWADATIDSMLGYYPSFSGFSTRTLRTYQDAEMDAMRRASLFVGASEWAAHSARTIHNLPATKVACVPFGANIDPSVQPPSPAAGSHLRLLLVGVDWARKGVDMAIATVNALRARGVEATLDVAGCDAPRGRVPQRHVTVHGFLDKSNPVQSATLDRLYAAADLFILPSRYECFGMAYCEAAAYGLPSLARDTGGVGSAVIDGVSGILLPPDANAEDYADRAVAMTQSASTRQKWRSSSRDTYERVLNWQSATAAVMDLVDQLPTR